MQSTPAEQNLTEDSPFHFACHDALPCFTQCCNDVNIYLTPYDVLRLRQALRIGSSEFLAKYTRSFLTRVTNIPVVQLLMDHQFLRCPFVAEEGCRVYENRPWACRMFPLDLASTDAQFRLISGKERCKGLSERSKGTVGDWLESQAVLEYVEMDREFQSVVPACGSRAFQAGRPDERRPRTGAVYGIRSGPICRTPERQPLFDVSSSRRRSAHPGQARYERAFETGL